MSDGITESTEQLLKQAFGAGRRDGGGDEIRPSEARGPGAGGAYCANVKLYARTQYTFYVSFQALVLVIALATALALAYLIWQIVEEVEVAELIGLLGTAVSGAAAAFILRQANAAKRRFDESMRLLKESGCM